MTLRAATETAAVSRKAEDVDPTLFDVGAVEEFPIGKFRIVQLGETLEIGVLRRSDGQWRAIRNACPHRLAPICKGDVTGTMVPGDVADRGYGHDENVVRCPWHAYEFELDTGRALYGTFTGRLRMFEVVEHGGRVYVRHGVRK